LGLAAPTPQGAPRVPEIGFRSWHGFHVAAATDRLAQSALAPILATAYGLNMPCILRRWPVPDVGLMLDGLFRRLRLDKQEISSLQSMGGYKLVGQTKSLKLLHVGTPSSPTTHSRSNGDFLFLGE
jgi:hypothetical protein